MKVLIIDNYDSFTYNLYQYIGEILTRAQQQKTIQHFDLTVKRNNEITLDDVKAMAPDRIIISPGPGSPDDPAYFGVCADVIREMGRSTPLLGVCLGMQGIAHVFGGNIVKAQIPMHGKTSTITHDESGLFENTPNHIEIMRYHSLVAEPETLPECLAVTAIVGEHSKASLSEFPYEEIMAIKHKTYPIHGIQYHPESFATEGGKELMANFLFNIQ